MCKVSDSCNCLPGAILGVSLAEAMKSVPQRSAVESAVISGLFAEVAEKRMLPVKHSIRVDGWRRCRYAQSIRAELVPQFAVRISRQTADSSHDHNSRADAAF